jgi:hypothetical protein
MGTRVTWAAVASAVALFSFAAAGSRLPQQASDRRESFSSSVGPVSPSVIGSWQAHGADDGPIAPLRYAPIEATAPAQGGPIVNWAPPGVAATFLPNRDWMLDFLVLWRWPGQAPEMTQGGGGETGRPGGVMHRIVAGERELRVVFDPQKGTVLVDGVILPLNGANVLMLDVEETGVRVVGLASVPRYSSPADAVDTAWMARSPSVAAFLSGAR